MEEKRIDIEIKENTNLALWKIVGDNRVKGKNVFLTHGTFSNRKVCKGIGTYLAERGYTCWVLEWRNHGESSFVNEPYNFEKIAKVDIKKAFDYLFEVEKIENIDCVTHSGGGISLIINLIENPENIKRIIRIVLFACQSSGAGHSLQNRLILVAGKYLSKALGFFPGKIIGSPHNEDYSFMKQWFNWNLSKDFLSESGIDYYSEMPNIQIPILSISGSGDRFIAPMIGCKEYLLKFRNPKNKFIHCGLKSGFLEDYSHSRLIYSRNAQKEIYPEALKWISYEESR